ncbi:MAG: hypothetical protein F6K41_27830 [Symploca sp. SIO3E6]|nr:hypothetical protein [Caldora sp. SIO3E6]
MTYLGFPRLHFSGRFQADVPTVNNDPAHFNNTTFKPEDQEYQEYDGDKLVAPNGWWNPGGSGNWRFGDCVVNKVYYQNGSSCDDSSQDPVIGMQINPDQKKGRIVDLDSENQNVSEIWGFEIELTKEGANAAKGEFKVVGFADLWFNRSIDLPPDSGDSKATAFYQSIIENIDFSGLAGSRFFDELGTPTKLSIKFTVDRFRLNKDPQNPDYTWGRIVGVIGPYEETEPYSFVPGRLLYPKQTKDGVGEFNPGTSTFCYAPCIIDQQNNLLVDLANSFQADGDTYFKDVGNLQVAVKTGVDQYKIIGPINYREADWYIKEAGIQTFSDLPQEAFDHQLAVVQADGEPGDTVNLTDLSSVYLLEQETGLFARADKFVFRLSSNNDNDQTAQTTLYAYQWGQPVSQTFYLRPDSYLVKQFVYQDPNEGDKVGFTPTPGPDVATPDCGLMLGGTVSSLQPLGNRDISVTTNTNGQASIYLQGTLEGPCFENNPYPGSPDGDILGGPRGYIDGQVYGVYFTTNYEEEEDSTSDPSGTNSSSNLLNVLVWNKYDIPAQPNWVDDVQTIFQQYANLYPVMSFLNLADYNSVTNDVSNNGSKSNLDKMRDVFGLEPDHVAYMPVTRDLSTAKRQMIRTWLAGNPPLESRVESIQNPANSTPDFKQIAIAILTGLALFGLGYLFWH